MSVNMMYASQFAADRDSHMALQIQANAVCMYANNLQPSDGVAAQLPSPNCPETLP